MTITALQFPGSVTDLTTSSLVNAFNINAQDIPQNIIYAYNAENQRTQNSISVGVDYYIETEYNLDDLVTYETGAADGTDDTWGFAIASNGVTASNVSSIGNLTLALPTCSNVPVLIQTVELFAETSNVTYSIDGGAPVTKATSGTILDEAFKVFAYLTLNSSGLLTATTAFAGVNLTSITLSVADDVNLAQAVSFGYENPINAVFPSANDADILTATLTAETFNTAGGTIATKLESIRAVYNDINVLQSWSYTFSAQPLSQTNQISRHARFNNWVPGQTPYFGETDRIVTSSGRDMVVDLYDKNDARVELVNDVVYGVLKNNRQK